MRIEKWDISRLKNWEKNPRAIKTEDFERLKKQITDLGLYKAFLVEPDGNVLGGNMRLKACIALGKTEVMVSIVEPKNDDERLKYALSDNDRAGYYEEEVLAEMLYNVSDDFPYGDYKVDLAYQSDLQTLMNQFGPDDEDERENEVPEPEAETTTKIGDIFELGRSRIMCGDATSPEHLEKLMDGQEANISFTSPPYNIGKSDKKYRDDADNKKDYVEFLEKFTNLSLDHSAYSFVNLQFLEDNKRDVIKYLDTMSDRFVDIAFWKKANAIPAPKNVMNGNTEVIFIFGKSGKGRAISTANFRGTVSNIFESSNASGNENAKIHKATYPVVFPEHFIKYFTQINGIVLDPFLGTGTTLIAAEKTKRQCYGVELDPIYVDVAVKRWEKYTNAKAKKI
jgi:DNA modification methylase